MPGAGPGMAFAGLACSAAVWLFRFMRCGWRAAPWTTEMKHLTNHRRLCVPPRGSGLGRDGAHRSPAALIAAKAAPTRVVFHALRVARSAVDN